MRALLISANKPHIVGSYNTAKLNLDEYHTGENDFVFILSLIHSSGFKCPKISESSEVGSTYDYSH